MSVLRRGNYTTDGEERAQNTQAGKKGMTMVWTGMAALVLGCLIIYGKLLGVVDDQATIAIVVVISLLFPLGLLIDELKE